MPVDRARPAAYIRAADGDDAGLARHRDAVAEGARQRGWPPATIYTEDETDLAEGNAPALARLEAAIETGRHDALLITEPCAVYGTASHLLRLLHRCTRHGVVVGFLLPPPPPGSGPAIPPRHRPGYAAPVPPAHQAWGVLARAHIDALCQLYPGWRIWLDQRGWHARRRDTTHPQIRPGGAPVVSVHADTPTELAAQLCWQQATGQDTPDGCTTVQPPGSPAFGAWPVSPARP